jgi:hypothetical protein
MNCVREPKYAAYFFRPHSYEELRRWTERLSFFRFRRALGGHANDGDVLLAALRVRSEAELVALARTVGIPLRELPPDAAEQVVGAVYSLAELAQIPTRIEAYPRFAQPGHIALAGVGCWCWIYEGRLELSLSGAAGDGYEVTEADVENAVAVEALLAPVAGYVLDPPLENERCFRRDLKA